MKIKMISLTCEGQFGIGNIIIYDLDETVLKAKYEEVEVDVIDENVFNGFGDVINGELVFVSGYTGLDLIMGIDGKFSFDEMKKQLLIGIEDDSMEIYVEKMRNAFEMNDTADIFLY